MEDETEVLRVAVEDSPQPHRAQLEGQKWAEEKRAGIEARLNELNATYERQQQILSMPDSSLVAGIERWYSASETARFFGRTTQWIYDRLRKEKFRYRDGTPIKPIQFSEMVTVTKTDPETGIDEKVTEEHLGPYRFTLPLILEVAQSCYRDGTVKLPELKIIRRRVAEAEFEEILLDPDDE
jgi:hypothetical protein